MSTIETVPVKAREVKGTTACRRLRCEGLVPCNLYGHKEKPTLLTMEADDARALLRSGSKVIDLEMDGKQEKALVKDVQWDTFSAHLLHIDFLRVDPNEKIHTSIPVVLRGTAPGVIAGGALEQPSHTLEIECLAVEVPDNLQVRIGSLQLGGYIHVSDLTDVPKGVTILTPPETVVVHIASAAPEPIVEGAGVSDAEAEAPAPEADDAQED